MGRDGDATIPRTPAGVPPPPVKLPSRYKILAVLGEGGMGRVYRAHDTRLGRDVAIKILEKDVRGRDPTAQRARFVREARMTARLAHPNVVAIHDVDPDAEWLVMGLVDGTPLDDRPLPATPVFARAVAEQVLAALEAAHGAGVVHRDIKPSNIIVGADNHVTLVDFGIARLLDKEPTQTGENVGTPAYMAPEQLRGVSGDARTDLYSLAATLYELATGDRVSAFESPSEAAIAKLRARCDAQIGLANVIEHCLHANPADRCESATIALAMLINASDPDLRKMIRKPTALPVPRKRSRVWPALLVLLLLAGGAGAYYWFVLRPQGTPDARIDQAFTLAQRGEHERAAQIVDDYLGKHPADPDALSLRVLAGWWMGADVDSLLKRAFDAPLSKAQRALMRVVQLTIERREAEAAAFIAGVDRELPNTVEIVYALGETQWHTQHLDVGAQTLERAFRIDPRWQVALHHPIEYRLTRGEPQLLRPLADSLRHVDPASGAVLDCKIAIAERAYAKAATVARDALARDPVAEVDICLAHALVLSNDLAASGAAAKRAFDAWPIDTREWGGFAIHAEHLLYHGKLEEYLSLVRGKPSRQRSLALAMWRPSPDVSEPNPLDRKIRTPPPLGAALFILIGRTQGRDEVAVYERWEEPEVRLYGQGLAAEARNDREQAIAKYREGLTVPAKGDISMLLSHHLARVLHASGDRDGAAKACEAVRSPRVYHPYRAILLPDCILWSADPAADRWLVEAWQDSTFEHPAVVQVRKRVKN